MTAAQRLFEAELVEHVAVYAAEHGDTALEQLCDDALAGATDEQLVLAAIGEDADLTAWCGQDQRYRSRSAPGAAVRAEVAA